MSEHILLTPDDEAANPRLSEEEINVLEASGTPRSLADGDVLYRAGEAVANFYLVLEGEIRIEDHRPDEVQILSRLRRGNFLGEFGILTGGPTLMTNVAEGPTRLLCLPVPRLLEVVAEEPILSETILRAYLIRRSILVGRGLGVQIVGPALATATRDLVDFLTRNRVPHSVVELDDAVEALAEFAVGPDDLPLVLLGERVLRRPSTAEVARELGIARAQPRRTGYDLVVIGGGPAGLAAAVYAASEGLSTVVLEAVSVGGQAGTSSRIENYPGFPAGISGAELASRTFIQAAKFGVEMITPARVIGLDDHRVRLDDGGALSGRAVLIATGARYRGLDVPRVDDLRGAGIYYAATQVEAEHSRDGLAVVVGGGNSAGQAALFLAESASRVVILIRRDSLEETMSRYLIDRIASHDRIDLMPHTRVRELIGDDHLNAVVVEATQTAAQTQLATHSLYVFTGAQPHTGWLEGRIALDEAGFVLSSLELLPLETSVPGVFVAGDVRSGSTKRVATAVGEGALAISSVHQRLRGTVSATSRHERNTRERLSRPLPFDSGC